MNTNNGVKWRRYIVPKQVEQIINHLFIDTYKSKKNIKIMTVNDSEMCVRVAVVVRMRLTSTRHQLLVHIPFHCWTLTIVRDTLNLHRDMLTWENEAFST